ncbi:MAG: ferrous iron transporter B [Gammaproteobacteria bacterium RIFCSPLOWO2_02_FULL_52_10]|nr:MAG: ferrous iron transporter B [Gammaproteobacteria bacterium RIFCSPLOWO2_02_FULL_52_10]
MSEALIIGTPNSGKSLLFNRLTGLHQKVANFPGITVDISSGPMLANPGLELVDFPGVYSLHSISEEERIAVRAFKKSLADEQLDYVICILDASRLEKGLHFAMQVLRECQAHGKPMLIAANMIDILTKHDMQLDTHGLARALGVPVLPISAKTGLGLHELAQAMDKNQVSQHQHVPVDFKGISDVDLRQMAHKLAEDCGPKGDLLIRSQARLDAFFLHTWTGGAAFFLIMYLLFQSIFTWAAPAMDAVEALLAWLAALILPLIAAGGIRDFVKDALFGGIGAFLVFVPQIFVLTLVVGILEDTGYLARAAVICHQPLRIFGLTGKSFIPMLSGVACAIPGIYAARTVDSPYKRWLTYFAIPLMPCSARLPVYTLIIAAFIPAREALGGLVGLQGLAMFMVYFFGMMCGLLVTSIVSRFGPHSQQDMPFVLEMPPYRLPSWKPLLRNCWNRSRHFVTKAGSIIFTVTMVVWFLGYFPNGGTDLGNSWLGWLGKIIEPVFQPLGLDWKYGVALLTSFLAREVFVGTLGTLYGIEGADNDMVPLVEQIQASGITLASGVALLILFAIALQCVSTLAILQKETNSLKLPVQMFIAYAVFAYCAAWIGYRICLFF